MKQQKMVVIKVNNLIASLGECETGNSLGLDYISVKNERGTYDVLWELPLKEYFAQGWTVSSFKVADSLIIVLLEKEQ